MKSLKKTWGICTRQGLSTPRNLCVSLWYTRVLFVMWPHMRQAIGNFLCTVTGYESGNGYIDRPNLIGCRHDVEQLMDFANFF